MLVEFSVSNFLSFRNRATLSLVASSAKESESTHVAPLNLGREQLRLLRSAVVYGANAAGKSNFLLAMKFMRDLVASGDGLSAMPFRFDPNSRDKPSDFEATIAIDGVRYQYGFSIKGKQILEEWLHAWPLGRVQTWFHRRGGDWKLGSKLHGHRDVWRRATRDNALFLTTSAKLNSEQLTPIHDWFRRKLDFLGFEPAEFSPTIECCKGDMKVRILDFLNRADIGISDIQVVDEERSMKLPEGLSESLQDDLFRNMMNRRREILTVHDTGHEVPTALEFRLESAGTRRLFALAAPWIDSLANGNVLIVDELEDSLHSNLIRFLVDQFHDPNSNPTDAQLVFSTHDTAILSQEVFRRDQVWLCERNRRQESRLVPLSDFRPRKGTENLERAYLSGRYGAVPLLPSTLPSDALSAW